MKNRDLEVQILGRKFTFSLPETVEQKDFFEIVDFVENRFSRVKKETGNLDSFRTGLLVAINIADELFTLRRENGKMRSMLSTIDQLVSEADEPKTNGTINFSPRSGR